MTTFIIICLIAIAIEASRRYFIVYKYCKNHEPFWMAVITSAFMVLAMVGIYYIHDWLSLFVGLGAALVYNICVLLHEQVFNDYYDYQITTAHQRNMLTAYMLSFYFPLLIAIPFTVVVVDQDDRAFDIKWQETAPLTISEAPVKTIVNGNGTVVLEFNEPQDELSFGVNECGFDILKLEKTDKIKYLKEGRRERFEIITLHGQDYKR